MSYSSQGKKLVDEILASASPVFHAEGHHGGKPLRMTIPADGLAEAIEHVECRYARR